MKRYAPALAVILGCFTAAWAAVSTPLTSLRAIRALTNDEANQNLPVVFEATVTFLRASETTLFVQDGNEAIYVFPLGIANFLPGDRVLIKGTTHADFSPSVIGKTITFLHHGVLPRALPSTYEDLIRGEHDCRLVTVKAVIRAVDVQMRADTRDASAPMHPVARVQMLADGGPIEALVDGGDSGSLFDLLDAEVEFTGIGSFTFDGKMQPTGVEINVTSRANFRLLKPAKVAPWSIPPTAMDRTLAGYRVHDLTQRLRVHGTITYYQPGSAVVIQDGTKSLWISTMTHDPIIVGDVADAIGFPDAHSVHLAFTRAEIKDSKVWAPILPKPTTPRELEASGSLFDLVSIEGQVVASVREVVQDEYVLVNNGQIFTAIYRRPETMAPPTKQIPVGSRVRATGICVQQDSNRFIAVLPFDILLRTPDDISIVANPSLLSTRNLMLLVGLLLVVLFAIGTRAWLVERRVRNQTVATAFIEQWRGQILEKINSSLPLDAIIEDITELASWKMQGAPCFCQIAGGPQLGNCPTKLTAFRVIHKEISGHSGEVLGFVFIALNPLSKPRPLEAKALKTATALAALAIETHRLYSDLLHRSEFDQLTNAHNRFSLDKHLDDLIDGKRNNDGIFGLVYVDLDRFKQINDVYGHHVGDLYLKEVAFRMRSQLRSVDTLARIGGDEFAVLLPAVRSRDDVDEIALRLEQSFDQPFIIDGVTLHTSASVGVAVYPQDGASKELMLRVADTAMYAAKNNKRRVEITLASGSESELSQIGFA